ncbi:HNH endonuclease [Nesterenkonia rhizosphaerae]|uniref:HNH domain-containing protein n=1 Tax=Nesterenkonia rhizosphaerae TaxID=1348272 RepID=A0ABP9FZ81_9MICC
MPFFQVDDQLHINQKAQRLLESAISGDISGVAALGLWTVSGSTIQAAGTDGLISETQLMRILLNKQAVDLLAGKLVEVAFWHAPGHDCTDCPQPPPGSYVFHQWFQFGYDPAEELRLDRAKKKELKDPRIIAAVWARDSIDGRGKEANCRYCGDRVKRADRKGAKKPELDHVDPGLANGATNIVISCHECNRHKGRRTPEQAGLTLREAPAHARGSVEVESNSPNGGRTTPSALTPHAVVEPAAPRPAQAVSPTRADHGQIKSDISQISDQISTDRAISGPARGQAGSGREGLGLAGPGGAQQGSRTADTPNNSSTGKRRRRRKRRAGTNPESQRFQGQDHEPMQRGRAGEAPEMKGFGQYGSPWHNHHGRPSTVDETTCDEHGLEMPCRTCKNSDW